MRSRCQASRSSAVTWSPWCSVQLSAAIRSSASSRPTARRISRSNPLRASCAGGGEVFGHGLMVVDLGGQAVERQRVADDDVEARTSATWRVRGFVGAGHAKRKQRAVPEVVRRNGIGVGVIRQRRMEHLADARMRCEERGDPRRRSPTGGHAPARRWSQLLDDGRGPPPVEDAAAHGDRGPSRRWRAGVSLVAM